MKKQHLKVRYYRFLIASVSLLSFGLITGCKLQKPEVRYGVKTPNFTASKSKIQTTTTNYEYRQTTD